MNLKSNPLNNKKGSALLETVIAVMILLIVLVLCMQVFTVLMQKQQLQAYTRELAREIEVTGIVNATTDTFQQRLNERFHLTPEVSYSKRGKLSFGQSFWVRATLEGNLGLFAGFDSFSVPLVATVEGKSEVYHK